MIKKILIILILALTSCGYSPVNNNEKIVIKKYSNIEFEGDEELTNILKSKLNVTEDKSNLDLDRLKIKINYDKVETSKDTKGQSLTFISTVFIEMSTYKDTKLIKNINFEENFNFEKKDNQYLQKEYEEEIKQRLLRNIIDRINLSIRVQ
jgi:hypothetical protein